MNGFDMMAEAKMRQWEKEKKTGCKSISEKETISVSSGESLEKQLYAYIKRLIKQSFKAEPVEQKQMLKEAEKLQIQLSARLERSGYNNISKYFSDEIKKLKAGNSE